MPLVDQAQKQLGPAVPVAGPVRLDRTWDGASVEQNLAELGRVLRSGGSLSWHRSNATELTARQDASTLRRFGVEAGTVGVVVEGRKL